MSRLAAEREAAREEAENPKPRKKAKRNPDPLVGNNAKHFELVTVDNISKHRVRSASFSDEALLQGQGWLRPCRR